MIEKPILFSGPMVRAILAGRKTMTRRIVKLVPPNTHDTFEAARYTPEFGWQLKVRRFNVYFPPILSYAVGDKLWVREAWAVGVSTGVCWHADSGPGAVSPRMPRRYRADGEEGFVGKWRPSIHMPRWACRLRLHVTAVKVERLQDISEDDAKAEGADRLPAPVFPDSTYRQGFKHIWQSIHGPGAWQANPWVAAYTFERVP